MARCPVVCGPPATISQPFGLPLSAPQRRYRPGESSMSLPLGEGWGEGAHACHRNSFLDRKRKASPNPFPEGEGITKLRLSYIGKEMSNGILVFIEHKSGALNKTSLEAIAAAQKLAGDTGQK